MSLILSGDTPKITADSTGVITSGTAVASTSGTQVNFTDIPNWVKRITVMFNGVSTNGTSPPQIQLGSGSVINTGYLGNCNEPLNATSATNSSGLVFSTSNSAGSVRHGTAFLCLQNNNTWTFSGTVGRSDSLGVSIFGGSSPNLSGTLDRIRITTVNGTDTFDAGSINIMYE